MAQIIPVARTPSHRISVIANTIEPANKKIDQFHRSIFMVLVNLKKSITRFNAAIVIIAYRVMGEFKITSFEASHHASGITNTLPEPEIIVFIRGSKKLTKSARLIAMPIIPAKT